MADCFTHQDRNIKLAPFYTKSQRDENAITLLRNTTWRSVQKGRKIDRGEKDGEKVEKKERKKIDTL